MNELIPKLKDSETLELMKHLKDTDRSMYHEANLSLPESARQFAHSLEIQNLREKLEKNGKVKL